jgi:hypothetical protein
MSTPTYYTEAGEDQSLTYQDERGIRSIPLVLLIQIAIWFWTSLPLEYTPGGCLFFPDSWTYDDYYRWRLHRNEQGYISVIKFMNR